jgi:hypothetical protein
MDVDARARELLAAEWDAIGWHREATMLRAGSHPMDNTAYDKRTVAGFRAIAAALREQPEARGVVEYQYRCPKASDPGWRRMTKDEYDATLRTGHACGNTAWTRDVEVRALYEARFGDAT